MDTPFSPPLQPPPQFRDMLTDARSAFRRSVEECEAFVRDRPVEALLGAYIAGSLTGPGLSRMLGTGLRVAWLAAPAALTVLAGGALAAYLRRNDRILAAKGSGPSDGVPLETAAEDTLRFTQDPGLVPPLI